MHQTRAALPASEIHPQQHPSSFILPGNVMSCLGQHAALQPTGQLIHPSGAASAAKRVASRGLERAGQAVGTPPNQAALLQDQQPMHSSSFEASAELILPSETRDRMGSSPHEPGSTNVQQPVPSMNLYTSAVPTDLQEANLQKKSQAYSMQCAPPQHKIPPARAQDDSPDPQPGQASYRRDAAPLDPVGIRRRENWPDSSADHEPVPAASLPVDKSQPGQTSMAEGIAKRTATVLQGSLGLHEPWVGGMAASQDQSCAVTSNTPHKQAQSELCLNGVPSETRQSQERTPPETAREQILTRPNRALLAALHSPSSSEDWRLSSQSAGPRAPEFSMVMASQATGSYNRAEKMLAVGVHSS